MARATKFRHPTTAVTRLSRRVTIDHDDGSFVTSNPLHITQTERLRYPAA